MALKLVDDVMIGLDSLHLSQHSRFLDLIWLFALSDPTQMSLTTKPKSSKSLIEGYKEFGFELLAMNFEARFSFKLSSRFF